MFSGEVTHSAHQRERYAGKDLPGRNGIRENRQIGSEKSMEVKTAKKQLVLCL